MKVKLLEGTDFRGVSYKKGKVLDVPDGLAHKMFLNSKAEKFSGEDVQEIQPGKPLDKMNKAELLEYADSIDLEVDNSLNKQPLLEFIKANL